MRAITGYTTVTLLKEFNKDSVNSTAEVISTQVKTQNDKLLKSYSKTRYLIRS